MPKNELESARYLRAFVIATLLCCFRAEAIHAESWPMLPDGRVLIDLKGISVALPREGDDNSSNFRFFLDFLVEGRRGDETLSVAKALLDPKAAREKFALAYSVSFTLSNSRLQPNLLLGRFERSKFPAVFSVHRGSVANCSSWRRSFLEYAEIVRERNLSANPWGWVRVDGSVIPHLDRSPANIVFLKFADDTTRRGRFLAIGCDVLGGCSTTKCLDGNTSAFFKLGDLPTVKSPDMKTAVFDTFAFDAAFKNASELLEYVLIGRPVDLSYP